METVTIPLTSDWTNLSNALLDPFINVHGYSDGDTFIVQAADEGDAHAVVIAQSTSYELDAPAPAARAGHLLRGGARLRLASDAASGRNHWGRAYMGSASVVVSPEGTG